MLRELAVSSLGATLDPHTDAARTEQRRSARYGSVFRFGPRNTLREAKLADIQRSIPNY
jgi:hypothetical protein